MKTIVVFYPYNNLAIDQLSILEFLNKKFNVILLTIDTRGDLHRAANKIKIENLSIFENKGKLYKLINKKIFLVSKFLFYFYLLYKFPIIIKKRKVNFVFAHLEIAGLISSIYENILNFKSFYFRHSADANFVEGNFKSKILHKVINFLSKNIICGSAVKDQMIRRKSKSKKSYKLIIVIILNYLINLKFYKKRKRFLTKINLITIGRLVDLKRHIHI